MAGSTPIYGFPYPESSDLVANYPALGQDLAEDIESVLSAGFGKILQVVRATDTTNRSTTSTTAVDVTGMTVSITPKKADSNILVLVSAYVSTSAASCYCRLQITDSANATLSGGQQTTLGGLNSQVEAPVAIMAWVAAVNTSARSYKLRFFVNSGTASVGNATNTGQIFAIEVGA